jgi:O-methyltransferase
MIDSDIITLVKPYTCVSEERLQNVLMLVERVVRENIPGDLAEVGVWKGGVVMAMALKCKQLGVTRTIHLYDTFSGMTMPTDQDVDLAGNRAKDIFDMVRCDIGLEEVQRNLALVDYPEFVYHVGDITKSDVSAFPTFSLLRLDTDWYESTKFELTYMEPKVSPFGFVIVDDYGHWRGSRRAVDEFSPYNLQWIDYTGVWWQRDFGRSILEKLSAESEAARALLYNFHHFIALGPHFHRGCGSYMIDGQRYVYQADTLKKQQALFNVGKASNRVLEIGVYLGHSLLLLLLSNPNLEITCIDNDDTFSPAAVEYLNKHFGNRVQFFLGNSRDVLTRERLGQFDCIHIDADHREDAVSQEFILTRPFAVSNAFYVFDDYEALRSLIDRYISAGILLHVETPWCLWTNIITRLKSVSS